MKRFFPGRVELAVFAAMALLAGALVACSSQHDAMLFFVSLPILLVASLMGLRRNFMLRELERVAEEVDPRA